MTKVIVLKPELNHINWLEEKKLKYAVKYLKSLKGGNELNIRVFDQYGQEYSYPDVGYFEHVVNDDNEVLDIKCVNGGYEITIKIIVRDYYEVLYYTGETEKEAFNNDFLSEQFDTEKEGKYNELQEKVKKNNKFYKKFIKKNKGERMLKELDDLELEAIKMLDRLIDLDLRAKKMLERLDELDQYVDQLIKEKNKGE